jgi:hypothetical protein
MFHFSVPTTPKREARLHSGRVVRGNPQSDGRWFVGCRLSAAFSDVEMAALSGVAPKIDRCALPLFIRSRAT